jgi:hypothetical protein
MSLPSDINPQLLALSSGYNLTRSLRFRSSASAYLSRTPASAGNRKTFTLSTWVKRGALGSRQSILDAYASSAGNSLEFQTSDTLEFYAWGGASVFDLNTTQVFRDPSAWYHIVVAVDTTQATASNRIKLYINGVQVTAFGTATYPSQNTDLYINNNIVHNIGRRGDAQFYFDGYLAEDNFIDGQALTPSSFGSTNALTGVWQPAKYGGAYGTNGFYLPFTDNSALTTSSNVGLGRDYSGNGNYWTTNNISITAGATYDSMTDVPTLTSATAANYCVGNPLSIGPNASLSDGNLTGTLTGSGGWAGSICGLTSGKWYYEATNTASAGNSRWVGFLSDVYTKNDNAWSYSTQTALYANDARNGNNASYGATWTTNDVIGVALDLSTSSGSVTFYKNGVSQGVMFSSLTSSAGWRPLISGGGTGTTMAMNFGQRPFAYTPPTGFVALNTFNLPDSTIVKGNKFMDATLYTGTGATQSITNAAGFKPDLVWAKGRSGATDHAWYDSVRGTTKQIESNSTGVETIESTGLTAFANTGFTVGALAQMNTNTATYVGWQWQAGGDYNTLQSYTTAGTYTYTVPSGVTSINVLVIGGGGGSGGSGAGSGAGGAGGNSSFSTVVASGGGGGGAGPNTPGAGGTAGSSGTGGDGGFAGRTGETGTGSGVTSRWSGSALQGYGDSAGHYGWGGGGGTGGSRYVTLSVTPANTYTVIVGTDGAPGAPGPGGGGGPGFAGAVFIYEGSDWPVNTSGSIPSLVNVNTSAGFSVVTYTGTGSAVTVGHGLGVAPSMVIVKNRDATDAWQVYHANNTANPETDYLVLNTNAATADAADRWNDTAPTSSVFSIGNGVEVNTNTENYVAYCWTPIAGFSAFGSYTGNGSTDGTFVYLGFRPKYFLVKRTDTTNNWTLYDTSRSPYNLTNLALYPDLSFAEQVETNNVIDLVSNGVKARSAGNAMNASGGTYIYAAFAENPFKNSLAR